MTGFSSLALKATLDAMRPAGASGDVCVAFSGGVDSTVLLAALAELKRAGWPSHVRAMHVDHQLHPDSGAWDARCSALSQSLGVPYSSERVVVPVASGQGVEAAARAVRYAALYRHLEAGETLLTAHHADDQLETVLLALMRGAGVRGLAGMPRSVASGTGWHQRPLLEYRRADLECWARERGLAWVEDPANRDGRYRRSFLRHEVVPRLEATWPQAAVVAARSARHLAESAELLDELALLDLKEAAAAECLRVERLAGLSSARRRNLLRYWLRARQLPIPSTRKLAVLEHDMLVARPDRHLCVDWQGAEVRLHRGLLYAGPPLPAVPAGSSSTWDWHEPLRLPYGLGELHAVATTGEGLAVARMPERLEWHLRGDKEQLVDGPHAEDTHRKLKKLLQQARVLPWWRGRLPLVSTGDQLLAVGDLWTAREFAASGSEAGLRLEWRSRPPIFASSDERTEDSGQG